MSTALRKELAGVKSFPRATISRSHTGWLVWLIPAGALLLCLWFVYRDYVATGPLITVTFPNADGLEEKNTPLRYRGVQVGQVKSIRVSQDRQSAEVQVRMDGRAADLARAGSQFWIVRPELTIGSVSGLGTIVSGNYLEVRPGNGPATNRFAGMEEEPVVEAPGALVLKLTASQAGSIQEKSPLYYRGIHVGEVLAVRLNPSARVVEMDARVWKAYAPLVRPETKFWNAGGLDVHVGLFDGLRLNAVSPKAIVGGGVEFATPPGAGPPVTNGAVFELNEKAEDKWKSWNPVIPLQISGNTPDTNEVSAATSGGSHKP